MLTLPIHTPCVTSYPRLKETHTEHEKNLSYFLKTYSTIKRLYQTQNCDKNINKEKTNKIFLVICSA